MISNSPITDRFFHALPGLAAGGDHARAGDAREASLGKALAQRRDQLGTEVVARCLAGDQNDERVRRRRASHSIRCFFAT